MQDTDQAQRFASLTTAHVADACLRSGMPARCAPCAVTPRVPGLSIVGRVLPARHAGSVDVFFEAIENARPGDVLVVDNGGRMDEACVGDLVVHEARAAGLAGVVVWGLHRDTADIRAIGLPLFSLGALPTGPSRLDRRHGKALTSAMVGGWEVGPQDLVLADDDGVLFIPAAAADRLAASAAEIRDRERSQADRVRAGHSLRNQLAFDEYLSKRSTNPAWTFREHLRSSGGAIEQ